MGHGSRFIADTAIERLIGVSNKALEYRTAQEQQLGYGWANGAAGMQALRGQEAGRGDVSQLDDAPGRCHPPTTARRLIST